MGRADLPAASNASSAAADWALPPTRLREMYDAYRRQQVLDFLALLSREALRSLYRDATSALPSDAEEVEDPVRLVSDFVEALLPLPPFGVWCTDLLNRPEAHLDESWMLEARPNLRTPLILDRRTERLGSALWRVELVVHHDDHVWRGHLAYRSEERRRSYRTTDVFREDRLVDVRRRFHDFDRMTLEAFLRSVVP